MLVSRQSRNQKKSINKIVLPGGAAEMRLARLFQSEELHPAAHRSTAFATRDTSRATRTDTEQHSKLFREHRHQHELTYAQRRAAAPTRQPSQMKRDLTVSGFVLALVSVGVLLSAYTDQPIFWLLVHHFRDWYSSAAVDFGWVRGARRENTRCGL
jgi:hypothetical protein